MGKLRDWQKKLSKVRIPMVERGLLKVLKQSEDLLVDANTGQLMEGEDSEGNPIDPPYASSKYAEFKLFLNPRGVVDLFLTGRFHSKFKLITSKWPSYILSTDGKAKEIEAKYGREIYGVQKETLGSIIQSDIKPDTQDYFRREVFVLR